MVIIFLVIMCILSADDSANKYPISSIGYYDYAEYVIGGGIEVANFVLQHFLEDRCEGIIKMCKNNGNKTKGIIKVTRTYYNIEEEILEPGKLQKSAVGYVVVNNRRYGVREERKIQLFIIVGKNDNYIIGETSDEKYDIVLVNDPQVDTTSILMRVGNIDHDGVLEKLSTYSAFTVDYNMQENMDSVIEQYKQGVEETEIVYKKTVDVKRYATMTLVDDLYVERVSHSVFESREAAKKGYDKYVARSKEVEALRRMRGIEQRDDYAIKYELSGTEVVSHIKFRAEKMEQPQKQ